MQRIYEPQDLLEAQMLLGMLTSEGVTAHLLGVDLLGAVGELPAGGLLGLWVTDHQAHSAQQLIAAYNAAQPVAEEAPQSYLGSLLC